ncbi:MAG: FAD-dependent oxidoreductase [Lentisphaerae bacterium]|jgi:flavin-dependent dehydrogenase|nr:FAD-dependent oxidoreductase [Lentisphaerota bacterium]MBT4816597.1 FAD-dependent oxidoreductase [Lentisphaerota bacterium]MBT5605033.1 FAD-dependent oxidoreductase [Lentisphaerota bacterium]MBT7058655.1 FAD-dependent oxidoreductase [Lentisphaerota bacterium]MBT7846996.1 FAD-dependent oxidoreductase [Lentisphaerota bacterium]
MKPRASIVPCVLASALTLSGMAMGAEKMVTESAYGIPIVHDVDVAVFGGSSAGVAAAVAAAEAGARVFLAAPRPYLGEDICAPYRLWLEANEKPAAGLAKTIFTHPRYNQGLTFSYEADLPSMDKHKDSVPPGKLNDGQYHTAFTQSVQYDGDVTIIIDLEKSVTFSAGRMMVFQGTNNYEVASVAVSVSQDKKTWQSTGTIENPELGKRAYVHEALTLALPVSGTGRYVRLQVRKGAKATRLLIGEIQLDSKEKQALDATRVAATTPMQVKRGLDDALLEAGVSFLYGCCATDVLKDVEGNVAGFVMVNRAGRQAVKAKVVIDATDRAWLARQAGAAFEAYPSGPQQFRRIVVGGEPRTGPGVTARKIPLRQVIGGRPPVQYGSGGWGGTVHKRNLPMTIPFEHLIEYTLTLPMADGSFASFAEAEQKARDLTFQPEQVDESEVLFQVPPDPVHARRTLAGKWPGAAKADLDAFRPLAVDYLYVAGGCAAVSRRAAEALLRPLEMLEIGSRIGRAAATEAGTRPAPRDVRLRAKQLPTAVRGVTMAGRGALRPWQTDLPTVPSADRSLPVLGEYDVVVIGGGTGGAPAGIGAARKGARTLVVEYLHGLGGIATTGLIGIYCAGYRKGFTEKTEVGIREIGATSYIVGKMEWWRREVRKAGGDIWFGSLGCGAFVENGKVKGAIVATPQGRGVVLADVVIDGTGHADVAAAAGADCMYTGGEHLGMQGAGLPSREPGASYINTDWTYIDDSDMIDTWTALIVAKRLNENAYDLGQLIDTRERRRIVGDYILSPLDIINRRTFPDTVGISQGGKLDKHGRPVHPYYQIQNFLGGIAYTPYRCLLPKGLDGILVIGLGISAHCDAIPSVRMQPGVQNLGFAAGIAAAMAAAGDIPTRDVDIRALQKQLVEIGSLTPEVMSHTDSYPLSLPALEGAVTTLLETDYSLLGIIMADTGRSLPILRKAHAGAATPEGKLRCAHVLGMLGDNAGVETLIATLSATDAFGDENISRYFPNMTWLDSYTLALGRSRDPQALSPLLARLELLNKSKKTKGSHLGAIARGLEALRHPGAAKVLADELTRSGLSNQTVTSVEESLKKRRTKSGRTSLVLARALYRCGDWDGLGRKVLEVYARDVRGHYARHARAILADAPGK